MHIRLYERCCNTSKDCIMKIRIPSIILTGCIVNFLITWGQSYSQMIDQAKESESQIRGSFKNLFNSITKNNAEKSEFYKDILKQEAEKEREVYNILETDFRSAQSRSAYKRRKFYQKSNIHESVIATKRETDENCSIVVDAKSQMNAKKVEDEFEGEQPYVFPDIEDGNAINATIDLLRSQRIYQRQIFKIFNLMLRKNQKNEDYSDLEHSIDGIIEFADELIKNSTKIIEAFVKNGSANDAFKREPLNYKTSRELIDCWKFIDDFVDDYIQMYNFDVDKEVDAMKEPVDYAIQEIEVYSLYLDKVYKETKKYRDEIYFRYPKYGRPYLQRRNNTTPKIDQILSIN